MIIRSVILRFCFLSSLAVPVALAQVGVTTTCAEVPREDASAALCAPPTYVDEEEPVTPSQSLTIALEVPNGTPLRIALDERVRVNHVGAAVHGKVVETVYAFDQTVVPAGSKALGHITEIDRVPSVKRLLAYANGNFSPFHKYKVTFEKLVLPDGKELAIKTTVSEGIADVVHLVSKPEKDQEKHKNAAARAVGEAKQEVKDRVHEAVSEVKTPGRMHRLKQAAITQLPYHRQYLNSGTVFGACLDAPLEFGETTRTREELAAVGSVPAADSLLHARLVKEVSSATASRGTPVAAVLTAPIFSENHQLVLPANSRLIGEVIQAKAARKFHRNGELRVLFERIETPAGAAQGTQGSLEGVDVDRTARVTLDEEGRAHTTDSKSRYLSTGLSIALAAAASRPDAEPGRADAGGGDPAMRAGAGGSGFGLAGGLISFAAKSTPVSMAFAAYGASVSIYANFLSRGREVVFPKDTPMEIGIGTPRPAAAAPQVR